MNDFLSLPTYLAKHFKSTWMACVHQFQVSKTEAKTTRTYFNGSKGGGKDMHIVLRDCNPTLPTAIVLRIGKGKAAKTAAAYWNGTWHALPRKDGEGQFAKMTIPSINKTWVDWKDLLPDAPAKHH